MREIIWHAVPIAEALSALETDAGHGLTQTEVELRLKKFGPNDFEKQPTFRFFKILWGQIQSPLIFILIAAGLISFLLKNANDGIIIFSAVAINTIVGAYQEGRASRAFDRLRSSVRTNAVVIRDRRQLEIDAALLVPGDIILLQDGNKVPADARLLEAKSLEINEAALTGEWAPVKKGLDAVSQKATVPERSNMVWMGTLVASGWAKAVVVATSNQTELGRIAKLVQEEEETMTPLQKGVKGLARWLGLLITALTLIVFVLGIFRGHELFEMFFIAVALAVAGIPEGLPVAVTVVLAVGMHRILQKGGLVRKLIAAETLGSTSIILTDKTGTLTEAKMKVASVITLENEKTTVLKTLRAASLASGAFVENPTDEPSQWIIRGKPTEKALFTAGIEMVNMNPAENLKKEPKIDYLPFDAERRFGASLCQGAEFNTLYVAGAPETVLGMSILAAVKDGVKTLDENLRKKLIGAYADATQKGSRVIALAMNKGSWHEIARKGDHMFETLTFLGFIAFHDPLRPDVSQVIADAKSAGVKIALLTGDHASTAKAVAEASGLTDAGDNKTVIEGSQIEGVSEKELKELVSRAQIFARILPHQKMNIVQAWQSRGEIVAMTGDGVNDAPALKKADVGIALGSGTDVAKESSDLVLLNDSLGVIVSAIEEGRLILDNLRKIITYLVSTTFSEIILIAGAILFGLPTPLLAGQILWANIVEEGFMNFAFAFEPKEKDIMQRSPKSHSSRQILTAEMKFIIFVISIITSLFLFFIYLFLLRRGMDLAEIRTVVFVGITLDALFFSLSLKSLHRPLWRVNIFNNPYFITAYLFSVFFLASAIYFSPLAYLLGTVPLNLFDFGVLFLVGIFNLVVIEAAKWVFISRAKRYKMEL